MSHRISLAILLALVAAGCDDQQAAPTKPVVAPSTQPFSLDDAEEFVTSEPPIIAASGDQGDYLITIHGIWLVRGTEAVRIREVPKFSTERPWKTTTQPAVPVSITVHNN